MRRLIASRPVRLVLVAVLVAGVAVRLVVVARRRRPAVPVARTVFDSAPAARETGGAADIRAPRGPEPRRGRPPGQVRRPEGGVPLTRPRGGRARPWTAALAALLTLGLLGVAVVLGVVVSGGQVLGNSVFAAGPEAVESSSPPACAGGAACTTPPVSEPPAAGPPTPVSTAPQALGSTAPGLSATSPAAGDGSDASCAPVRTVTGAAPAVRPISRRVTTAVNRQWRRIERWLRARAPRTYASLNGPASPRLIARAEQRLGASIPDSLRASLLRHDGARGVRGFRFPPSQVLGGARDMVVLRRASCAVGPGLPFAYDGNDGYLVTDPADGGVLDLPDQETGWSSYYALLKATADALATGAPVAGHVPHVENGVLEWVEA